MESVGTRLKKIRLEKGFGLEEVQKKTKIHIKILKAIEEDGLINFSPVYIKGFLKIYCKFLGVDPRDFIADYKEPQGQSVLINGLNAQYGSKKSIFFKIRPLAISLAAVVLIILFFNLGKSVSANWARMRQARRNKKDFAQKIEKQQGLVPKIVLADTSPGIRLGVRAREDCLVQVKVDGRLVFHHLLRRGRTENWQAKEKIELSLSNAGVVDLQVNERVIPPLGRRGQAVKNILINKEGLNILR